MNLNSLLPLLSSLMGGGNNITSLLQGLQQAPQNSPQPPNNIPANILASYPQASQDTHQQSPASSQPNNNGGFDMLSNLLPLLQNMGKQQKNSPLKISELVSVEEYNFD